MFSKSVTTSVRQLLFTASVICFFLAATTRPLSAQYRGSLQGTVTDSSGAVVPGAKVTLTSNDTSISKETTTNGGGVYAVPGLAPGHYSIKVEKTGFTDRVLNDVLLASEQAQSQDIQLQVGAQTAQTVTVNASEGPLLETETGTLSATLSSKQIQALPTFGRDTFQVAQLAPGTFGDNSRSTSGGASAQNLPGRAGPGGTSGSSSIFQTENQVQIISNGTRNSSNSFQVDGTSVNSLAWGGAAVITPNKESVKEVTVQSNPYSAENGRNSGAQVQVVSQNGTNQFHGSALMKFDRPGLNAFQRYNGPDNAPVQRDSDRFNQWAGSLGGPIIKNHLFFFFSYETLRNSTVSTGLNWYETPQLLTSAPANSIAAKLLTYPGEGVSYNAIVPETCAQAGLPNPATCAPVFSNGQYMGLDVGSPLRSALGTRDPSYVNNGTPGIGGGLDGRPDIMYVQTTSPFSLAPQQYNGRVDYQATSKDLITFSMYYVPVSQTSYNGPVRPANLWHTDRLNETGALLWNHTFSSAWLNEARFNVTRWHFDEISSNPQAPFGLPTDQIDTLGTSAAVQNFGAPGPAIFTQNTFNYRDTVSKVKGNHSIKIGVDIYKEQDNDDSLVAQARPSYNFHNLWDLLNDAPYKETGNFNPATGQPSAAIKYSRSSIYAGFVQDDWKARPNLTFNLGLRWEYLTPISEKYGNFSNPILGSGPNPLTDLSLKVGSDLYSASKNNWAPQLGFAWRPNPKSERFVVRGGFGIGYNRMQDAITLNGRTNPPDIASFTLDTSTLLYQIPANSSQFFGWPVNPNAKLALNPNTNLPVSGAAIDLVGFPTFLPTPITYRDSLGMEYDLGGNWVAKAGYQGSLSRHYTRQNNLNLLYSPVNPAVAHLNYFTNDANSSYNALLTEVQHRFANTFQIDAQYTWTKTIDDGSNDYYIGEYPYGLQYSKGPADFDVRHNVKVYGVWTPTVFKHGWKEKILGGWQISGILNWHSGFPWTPVYTNYGCNIVYANSGYCSLRPAASLAAYGNDSSNSAFMTAPNSNFPNGSLAYFSVPNYSTASGGIPAAPAVGRNTLRGPGYFDTDATIQKSFTLPKLPIFGENARFEFRGDIFNLFNKINLTPLSPSGTSTGSTIISGDGVSSNPNFGQPQTALAGRIVELTARFSF